MLKTRIKSHGYEVTDFFGKEFLKVDVNHTCLAVISLVLALKKDDHYYPQMFLKECEKKVVRHIIDDLEFFFDNSDDSDDSDEE